MATMDDIAKRLGVSKSTVSKALSGAADVSESMRKSVLEVAVELGYSRIERTGDAPKVAIFIENMEYKREEDFGYDLVMGFRKMAVPAGFSVDLTPITHDFQKNQQYDEYMMKMGYQGAFFLGISFQDPWVNDFLTSRTPAVLFDNRSHFNPTVTQVCVDNDEAMEMAIHALMDKGHKKIGYLSGALGSQVFQDRYTAFFRALRKFQLPDNKVLGGHAYHASECLEKYLPRLLDAGCTAIICSHDLLAQSLLIHCMEKGIRVPDDISVIGIDDLPICRYTIPSLSSLRQDRTELGKSAWYALSSQINGIRINSLKLHPELILRNSVGPAPIKRNS